MSEISIIIVNRWGIASPGVARRGIGGVSLRESPHDYRGIAGETYFGIGPQNIFWDCRGNTSFGVAAPSSIFEDCWNTASGVAEHHRLGLLGHHFWGRCTVIIVGLPERRLLGSVYRTYFGIGGGERLLVLTHHHILLRSAGTLLLELLNIIG